MLGSADQASPVMVTVSSTRTALVAEELASESSPALVGAKLTGPRSADWFATSALGVVVVPVAEELTEFLALTTTVMKRPLSAAVGVKVETVVLADPRRAQALSIELDAGHEYQVYV